MPKVFDAALDERLLILRVLVFAVFSEFAVSYGVTNAFGYLSPFNGPKQFILVS
jgi:hypothetical protein